MISPFLNRPWHLNFYDIDVDVQPALERDVIPRGLRSESVVLAAAYFGSPRDHRSTETLRSLRADGVSVIDDRTHNVFDWSALEADFVIASLRKLLPVGDGAVVSGGVWDVPPDSNGPGETYWRAMDLKALGDEAAVDEARRLFATAETRFEVELEPRQASSRTLGALHTLPYEAMMQVRRSNARALLERLGQFEIVNRDVDGGVPSHLVVRVNKPATVQRRLAAAGIFCPIHWPRPQHVAPDLWPDDIISLPIDHRYDEEDMEHVADVFKRAVAT